MGAELQKAQHGVTKPTSTSTAAPQATASASVATVTSPQSLIGNSALKQPNATPAIQAPTQTALALQRAAGNQAVQRWARNRSAPPSPSPIQRAAGPDLDASGPGDAGTGHRTALPGGLRRQVEERSGTSLAGVVVTRNSPEPSRIGAFAYTQGDDVHLGPGQDHLLPHEAWHVVQQKQGRVPPTVRLAGGGLPLNLDAGLEREADQAAADMLQPAEQTVDDHAVSAGRGPHRSQGVVQGTFDVNAGSFQALLAEQELYQGPGNYYAGATTVGLEHEFAQMSDGPLLGASHVELGESNEKFKLTGIPFKLETDASDEVELVSPPFVVNTIDDDVPIPNPVHVDKIDKLIKQRLEAVMDPPPTVGGLVHALSQNPGLNFAIAGVKVGRESLTHRTGEDYWRDTLPVPSGSIRDIPLKKSRKFTGRPIHTQVNFATDAATYDRMRQVESARPESGNKQGEIGAFATLEEILLARLDKVSADVAAAGGTAITPAVRVFLAAVARTLSGQLAVPSMMYIKSRQEETFGEPIQHQRNQLRRQVGDKGPKHEEFEYHSSMSSHVKDVSGIWIKDSLWNIGFGLLRPQEWGLVAGIAGHDGLIEAIKRLKVGDLKLAMSKAKKDLLSASLKEAIPEMVSALGLLVTHGVRLEKEEEEKIRARFAEREDHKRAEFMSHDPNFIGPRQDTYIPGRAAQIPSQQGVDAKQGPAWNRRLHVVEARGDPIAQLARLAADSDLHRDPRQSDAKIAAARGLDEEEVTRLRAQINNQ